MEALLLKLPQINRSIINDYLSIRFGEQPAVFYNFALKKTNEDFIDPLFSETPLKTEQQIQAKLRDLSKTDYLTLIPELHAHKKQIAKLEKDLLGLTQDPTRNSAETKMLVAKMQDEIKRLKDEFNSNLQIVSENIQAEFTSKTSQVLKAQAELTAIVTDIYSNPEFKGKTVVEIQAIILSKEKAQGAADVIKDYREFTSAMCSWIAISDPEAAQKISLWSDAMYSAVFVAANIYNPVGWAALASSVGNLISNLQNAGKRDLWRDEVIASLNAIDNHLGTLQEQLTIGLAWMQFGFRQNNAALASLLEGMTSFDRELKTFGIFLSKVDLKVEEVRMRLILQYNEEWNRAKAEQNAAFYWQASKMPESVDEARIALDTFVAHAVSDSW